MMLTKQSDHDRITRVGGFGTTLKNVLRLRRGGGKGNENRSMDQQKVNEHITKTKKNNGYISIDRIVKPSITSNDFGIDPNIRATTLPLNNRTRGTSYDQVWGPPPVVRSTTHTPALVSSRSVMGIELEEEVEGNGDHLQESESRQKRLYGRNRRPQGDRIEKTRYTHHRYLSEPVRDRETAYSALVARANPEVDSRPSPSGLQRSASINSTARARPQGRTPTAAELQKRSSQFIGYWCPYPGTVVEDHSGVDDKKEEEEAQVSQSSSTGAMQSMDENGLLHHMSGVMEEMENMESEDVAILSSSNETTKTNSASLRRSTSSNSLNADQNLSSSNSLINQDESVWAVSRGWKTGIYRTHSEANKQIDGFPGPLIRQFENQTFAKEWLNKNDLDARRIPSIRTLDIDENYTIKSPSMLKIR